MPNLDHSYDQDVFLNGVNDSVMPRSDLPKLWMPLESLGTWWTWILCQ